MMTFSAAVYCRFQTIPVAPGHQLSGFTIIYVISFFYYVKSTGLFNLLPILLLYCMENYVQLTVCLQFFTYILLFKKEKYGNGSS